MRDSRCRIPVLLVLVLGILLACAKLSYAGDLTYLALQREGQASIAVDEKKKAAYIIDLGRGGDGDRILLDGLPLLDRLEQRGVEDLYFVCSHPHSDHMGGIRALFRQPRLFFKDEGMTVPRFKSITVVDDAAARSLYKDLQESFSGKTGIRIAYESAANRNAFAGISAASDDVHVETIPYVSVTKPDIHGRSVVTYIRLGQKHTIVDFDDADSSVILKTVNALKARGVTKVNTFIAAHHGSRYHELDPVLKGLHPDRSIIPVNPSNRYGHPSPPVLRDLMETLGKKNVIFTGSTQNVVLNNDGVKVATYTGANPESYALFVAPNRIRAEKLKRASDVRDCVAIQQMMRDNGGGDVQPPTPGGGPNRQPPPPETDSGGGAWAVLEDEVRLKGTILQPEFEFGAISYGRDGVAALRGKKIFAYSLGASADLTGQDVAVVVESDLDVLGDAPITLSPSEARGVIQQVRLLGSNAERANSVRIFFSSPTGLRDLLRPALVLRPQELAELSAARPVATPKPGAVVKPVVPTVAPSSTQVKAQWRLPKGGMVFLQGDKLFPVGEATELLGGSLDLCGTKYCVKTSPSDTGNGVTYELPFSPGPLFTEVWERVYDERIDSFYLSINPTKQFLRSYDSGFDRIPKDKLRFGSGAPGSGIRTHEVVTAGNIEKTRIGQILWEADVAFKSESLGFDVLTGQRGSLTSPQMTRQRAASGRDLSIPYQSRWCRLYWTSGPQKIEINESSGRLSFTGKAVLARAEPMVMRGGELEEEPNGTWCSDPKNVAASLQKQANSGQAALPVLNRLRQLAELQSFIRWARDNGITPTESFRRDIAQHPSPPDYEVPNWTSGIKSEPRVFVQQQRSIDRNYLLEVVHISVAERSVVETCVEPYWEAFGQKARLNAIESDPLSNELIIPHEKYPLIDSWVTEMAGNISECSRGVLLKTGSAEGGEEGGEPRQKHTEIKYELHPQAVHMHGGVLLGMQRGFLKSAVQQKGLLLGLSRRPYFQDVDGKLHFWNFTDGHSRFGSSGYHVVINGGAVTDVRAADGVLVFEVKTQPGAVVLQESRWERAGDYTKGLEWAGARHASDGSWIREDAAWPCAGTQAGGPGCVRVGRLTLADLRAKIGTERLGDSAIVVDAVGESRWRVVLDVSGVRSQLDERWGHLPESDVNAHLSLVYEYAKWGFIREALRKYSEVSDKIEGDTVDTILRNILEAPSKDN